MELCHYQHEEIVYLGRDCPLCKALGKIDDLKDELHTAKDEIDALESQIPIK